MEDEHYDPRFEIEHEVLPGHVYLDSRDEVEHRVIYEDEHTVLLRYDFNGEYRHRLTTKAMFEESVGSGRFELIEPNSGSPEMPDEFEAIRETAFRLQDHYENLRSRIGDHKAEAIDEFLEELDEISDGAVEEFPFEDVGGIGSKAAENLRNEGFRTARDIRRTDRDRIVDIPLMGETNTDNLFDAVDQNT